MKDKEIIKKQFPFLEISNPILYLNILMLMSEARLDQMKVDRELSAGILEEAFNNIKIK
jgi:hypothetical protein